MSSDSNCTGQGSDSGVDRTRVNLSVRGKANFLQRLSHRETVAYEHTTRLKLLLQEHYPCMEFIPVHQPYYTSGRRSGRSRYTAGWGCVCARARLPRWPVTSADAAWR